MAEPIEMVTMEGHLPTGRPLSLTVPADITPLELVALIKLVTELPEQAAKRKAPRILTAASVPGGLRA
jgi:hypothetical protein